MQYSKYFPHLPSFSPSERTLWSLWPLWIILKGNSDLCMQTQMKTDPLVDEKGKGTHGWSTSFCVMLMTRWPCRFPQCIPNALFVNHIIDWLTSKENYCLTASGAKLIHCEIYLNPVIYSIIYISQGILLCLSYFFSVWVELDVKSSKERHGAKQIHCRHTILNWHTSIWTLFYVPAEGF